MPAGSDFVYPLLAGGIYHFNADGNKIDFIGGSSGLLQYNFHDNVTIAKQLTVKDTLKVEASADFDDNPIYNVGAIYVDNVYGDADMNTRMNFPGSDKIKWYTGGSEAMCLEADRDLHVDGDVVAYSSVTSDVRLKQNIKPLSNSLYAICNLEGVSFDWNFRDQKNQIGLIAQNVEKFIPGAIKEKHVPYYSNNDGKKYKTINYDAIVPHLIESIKELKLEINELKLKLENR